MTIIHDVFELSKTEPKTPEQQFLKLMEELGEASQAFLSQQKVSGNAYKELSEAQLHEELTDVLLVTLALMPKVGLTEEKLAAVIAPKIAKWQAKQGN